jgi:hypothetical protein
MSVETGVGARGVESMLRKQRRHVKRSARVAVARLFCAPGAGENVKYRELSPGAPASRGNKAA